MLTTNVQTKDGKNLVVEISDFFDNQSLEIHWFYGLENHSPLRGVAMHHWGDERPSNEELIFLVKQDAAMCSMNEIVDFE